MRIGLAWRRPNLVVFLVASVLVCHAAQGQDPAPAADPPASGVEAPLTEEDDDEAEGEHPLIETDRNSFTFTPFTPGRGRTAIEAAYSYIHIGKEGVKNSLPESIFRYGVTDRFELRLGYNYESGGVKEVSEGDVANKFGINATQQLQYGFKYQVSGQSRKHRFRPNSAILLSGFAPMGYGGGQTQLRLGYVFGWELKNGWTFDTAIRYGTDRELGDHFNVWSPSTVLKIPFGREKRWFTHLEYFSEMSQGKEHDFSTQLLDSGLHYFVTKNLEVGAIIGWGINHQSQGLLVNTGFGVRF